MDKGTSASVFTYPIVVERATIRTLKLGMADDFSQLSLAMCKLALAPVLAHSALRMVPTQFGLVQSFTGMIRGLDRLCVALHVAAHA